jgi:hypothetical protein
MPGSTGGEFYQLALEKMSRILGERRGAQLLSQLSEEHRIDLSTVDQLYEFGTVLTKLEGIEAAVGALLCSRAVMLGAAGSGPSSSRRPSSSQPPAP